VLMKRDVDGEIRPSREELEAASLGDPAASLAGVSVTRARAIKLAGAALAGSAFGLLWAAEADARKKKRRRKKRRRKARVTPNPVQPVASGTPTVLNIMNPSDKPLTISGVQLLDSAGGLLETQNLTDPVTGGPVTIAPHTTVPVTVTFDDPLVDGSSLRLLDGMSRPITVTNGDTSGNVPVSVSA
jgi:hypothetical protein